MGGASIFRVKADDANIGVICETLTEHGSRFAMAQNYIEEITKVTSAYWLLMVKLFLIA